MTKLKKSNRLFFLIVEFLANESHENFTQGIWLLRGTIDSTTKATCACQDLPTNTTLRAQSLKDSHRSVRVRRCSSFLLTVSPSFQIHAETTTFEAIVTYATIIEGSSRRSESSYNQARYSDNLETKLYLCKEHSLIFDMNMEWNLVDR